MTALPLRSTLAALAAAALCSACAPLLVGGVAAGSALVVLDRRTPGVQLEDQTIELKARNRVRDVIGERGHVTATSYNRTLLLTGEVDTEADKAAIEQSVAKIENLRTIVNELAAMPPASIGSRSNDTILTSKVKATFVDAKDLAASAFKVVTERGTVYLMGRVTEREAGVATELARNVAGVQKVVRVFDLLSEAEMSDIRNTRTR